MALYMLVLLTIIIRRVYEHKQKIIKGFTLKYNITKLVYTEEFTDIQEALTREKT